MQLDVQNCRNIVKLTSKNLWISGVEANFDRLFVASLPQVNQQPVAPHLVLLYLQQFRMLLLIPLVNKSTLPYRHPNENVQGTSTTTNKIHMYMFLAAYNSIRICLLLPPCGQSSIYQQLLQVPPLDFLQDTLRNLRFLFMGLPIWPEWSVLRP